MRIKLMRNAKAIALDIALSGVLANEIRTSRVTVKAVMGVDFDGCFRLKDIYGKATGKTIARIVVLLLNQTPRSKGE